MRLWFGFSILAGLAVPAMIGFLLQATLRWLGVTWSGRAGRIAFWSLAFLLGILASPLLGPLRGELIFTWPLSLLVAQQWTITAVVWSKRQGGGTTCTRVTMAALVGFLAVMLAYYQLCRQLALAPQWIFLIGLLPSWSVAVPAVYQSLRRARLWVDVTAMTVAFSFYFGICWLLVLARR